MERGDLEKTATPDLQFAAGGLDGCIIRLFILILEVGDLSTLPSNRTETLSEDRMREMVAGVHPVSIHGTEVLDLQLDKRSSKLIRVSKTLGKSICDTKLVPIGAK